MTGKRQRGDPASETFVRCKLHDTLPAGADMGRGCILYDDHEDWLGVGCHIGDVPAAKLRLPPPADEHAPDCPTDRKWSAADCGCQT